MNKPLIYTLAAALACLCMVSCNPDRLTPDENGNTPTEEDIFWGVVGKLVSVNDMTPDYKSRIFKPAIGVPDGTDESVRIVAVNSLEAAVYRYNNLTGASIDENTKSHTWKNNKVGTLTWNLSADNTCWATVDVSIPSVPSLQKLVYRSPEQGDVNGSVGDNGSAYYRFGDVIERTREDDATVEYWICVRPAFGPEGKGKCHWVCVSPLPKDNVWPYYKDGQKPFTASNGMEYGLPYSLRDDLEWPQDLAEMLFAIMYPEDWFNNIGSYSSVNYIGSPKGLPIFNDWHSTNIRYHNIDFWKNVQKQWKEKGIVQKVFGITYNEMAKAIAPDGSGRGLHLLYNGYSWNTVTSNKPSLFQAHYTHGAKNEQKNMHLQTKSRPSAQVVTPRKQEPSNTNFPFDFYKLNYERHPYMVERKFFGDDYPRWTVRFAEGEELATGGKYSAQLNLPGFPASKETYRYYKDVLPGKNLTDSPEETQPSQGGGPANQMGFFYPGVVIQDEIGTNWVCFAGWYGDPEEGVTKDRKARFFTSKGIMLHTETGPNGNGAFVTDNLPGRDDAANLIYYLVNSSIDARNGGPHVIKSAKEFLNLDLTKCFTRRDTVFKYENGEVHGALTSSSILYEPAGGRTPGTQPYLRYIYDTSHSGENRTILPNTLRYSGAAFYTVYNDSRGDMMDAVHLLDKCNYVTPERPIPSDKWSRCVRMDTGQRDGAFTYDMRYKVSFVDMSDFYVVPMQRKDAYHEPVLVLRYLELDDDSVDFKGVYNGKSYSLVSNPVPNRNNAILEQALFLTQAFAFVHNRDGNIWCTMNNQPYELDLYISNRYW